MGKRHHSLGDVEAIQKWRSQIPFTDAQIVSAVRAEADAQTNDFLASRYRDEADYFERTGRLKSYVYYQYAIPRLVQGCGMCGKKALYRVGHFGLCSTHKSYRPEAIQKWRAERESREDARSELFAEVEKNLQSRDHLNAFITSKRLVRRGRR